MMLVTGNVDAPLQVETVDYKKKYKTLKRKLKFLVYEHECFLEELRKAQRKLLKVTRDRSFLLDRLIQYEKTDDSSSDSEATFSSDSEAEMQKDAVSGKKKKSEAPLSMFGTSVLLSNLGYSPAIPNQPSGPSPSMLSAFPIGGSDNLVSGSGDGIRNFPVGMAARQPAQLSSIPRPGGLPQPTGSKSSEPAKKRAKVSKKAQAAPGQSGPGTSTAGQKQTESQSQQQPGHMTREELERHLDFKQSTRPQFMSIDKTPNTLPDDIFNNENSNPESDFAVQPKQESQPEDSDLIIDIKPQD